MMIIILINKDLGNNITNSALSSDVRRCVHVYSCLTFPLPKIADLGKQQDETFSLED